MSFEELLEQIRQLNRFTDQLEDYETAVLRDGPDRNADGAESRVCQYVAGHPVSMTAVVIAAVVLGKIPLYPES